MNYLSHAFRFLDQPVFCLGTQVPDFLNMVDRKARARRKLALAVFEAHQFDANQDANQEAQQDSRDSFIARLAAGIVQHHDDDQAFHASLAFTQINHQLGSYLKQHRPDPRGMRSWFVGHIATEMILDWSLSRRNPGMMDQLYKIFSDVSLPQFQDAVQIITGKPLPSFAKMHATFLREKFLYDYATDSGLLYRINRILERVGLEPFDDQDEFLMAEARQMVDSQYQSLLACLD